MSVVRPVLLQVMSVVGILQDETDPMVSVMKVRCSTALALLVGRHSLWVHHRSSGSSSSRSDSSLHSEQGLLPTRAACCM